MPAREPMLMMRPLEAMRSGMKNCVIAITPKTFVSKQSRASSRGTSRAGMVQLRPLYHLNHLLLSFPGSL